MRLPKHLANPGLAALIQGGGFRSLESFANAVNACGWEMNGVKLSYDHVAVKRWLTGSVCQNPEAVAAVLSRAWGLPIPSAVVWPELRDGQGPVPAHLQAWAAARTLEDLGALIGSDMLTRREVLAASVGVASGPALLDPMTRWLGAEPLALAHPAEGTQSIGSNDVQNLEAATVQLASVEARTGGGLSREAAVGQLKYAVDLARYANYGEAVGNRLLAAVAGLSGLVGWMCLDSGMFGPAQRYLLYGLQAARESKHEHSPLLVVRILADLAQHARWAGNYSTSVRLYDLSLSQLPAGRNRFGLTRAAVTSGRAQSLSYLGRASLPEVRSAVGLSSDLRAQVTDEEQRATMTIAHRSIDMSVPELSAKASDAYLVLARDDTRLAVDAEEHAQRALDIASEYGRNRVLAQIRLARVGFVGGEPDKACDDGERALEMAGGTISSMVTTRLRELLRDAEPYRGRARVRELGERVRMTLGA